MLEHDASDKSQLGIDSIVSTYVASQFFKNDWLTED